ncbi:hypothetical protein RHO13_00030 [Orbus wheelerorum]|uniref:hypothetical protein n=1 Tax=Orbus wheelerorum TaxID=3074111 RepID=UPI00370D4440
MRMGSDSRIKRSLVYCFCTSLCFVSYNRPVYSAVPIVAAAVPIIELFGGLVARRAIQVEGMNLMRVGLTRFATKVAANEALFAIPVASSLNIKGAITWAGVASAIGGYSVSELIYNDIDLKVATNAQLNADGSYFVDVEKDGVKKKININFKPEVLSPVFIYINSVTKGEASKINGVEEGYSYPDNARFYITKDAYSAPYYFGDNYEDVAIQAQQFRTYSTYTPTYTDFSETVTDKIVDSKGNISFTEKPYKLHYIRSESTFDFDIVGVEADSLKYTSSGGLHYHPDIEGLSMFYTVYLKVTTHTKSVNTNFSPCKTTTSSNGSTSTICLPPQDYDYLTSEREFTYNLRVSTNGSYKVASLEAKVGTLSELEPEFKTELQKQAIDYEVLADIFNEIMYSASSQTDYDGLPYSTSKPITAQEIQSVAKEMGLNLTQYDLFYSTIPENDMLADVEKQYTTIINNNTNNNNNGGNNSQGENVDYSFTPPELEDIPTGIDVLSYLDNLFPFLRDFELDEKKADCPIYHFDAFNQTYTIETHCPLLEQNRTLTEMIMLIVWAFVSLRIILKS